MRGSIYVILIATVLLSLVLAMPAGAAPLRADRGPWAPNVAYAFNDTVTYGGCTYSVLQAHTSLNGWEPPNSPSLFSLVSCGATPTNTAVIPSTNLALNKPATSSSNETTTYTPNLAVDGNTTTRWSSAFSDPQWIQIDLGATVNVSRVVLRWEAAYGSAYQIQVSDNATSWTNIYSTTIGTGGVNDLGGLSGSGRYIRMNGTARATAWGYSLFEFEVYGTSGPTITPAIPTVTRTSTPIGPTATFTRTPTRTNTPIGPSATFTRTPTRTNTAGPATGVTFYQDINYGGTASTAKAIGDYATMPGDVPNDWMSSLRVPSGWTVNTYSDGNFGGTVCTFTADTAWVGDACNDNMSSFRIRLSPTNTPLGPTVTFTRTPTRTNTPLGPTATFTRTNTPTGGQSAYPAGVAWAIPGTIQAENFDLGGETIAYHDLETANTGAQYRTTDGVDIEVTTDTGGGYNVGWTRTDEWMEYTVNVASAGNYTLTERVASGATTGSFRVEFNGVNVTGTVTVPNTGGWQTWQNLSQTVSLGAGQQIMRIYFLGNDTNLNYFSLSAVGGPTNTPTRTATPGGSNQPPNTPIITEPNIEGKIVNPGDVHMETGPFSDPNAGQTHACTDWEIWNAALTERVWFTSCIGGIERVHTHLGDGVFQGSLAGRTDLLPNTNYIIRVRHKDSSGVAASEWSAYAQRGIRTSDVSIGNPNQLWTAQAGYEVQVAATGFQLPVNIAFIPNAGTQPSSPLYYVTELYGIIKVVTRAGAVSDYATGLLNFNPTGNFPGSGEQGVTGIVVEPTTGDVFASMLYEVAGGNHYPKVVRFHSTNGGMTAATQTIVLDMAGETQGQSHQVSHLSFGPDGKLYVHMGDGFDATKGQDLTSFRGKILRMNLDGSAPSDNPLYNAADGITARDYVFAYGFRNPFGGAWRASDGAHYEAENGPSVDRFVKVVANRNYLYNGSDASMSNFAIYLWNPSHAPVNMVFIQSQTFSGSGFPAGKLDHLFISESGPTYTTGPQPLGKRIVEFVLDASGNRISGPTTLLEYTGVGKASVVALAAGPDGLYFSDLYKDLNYTSPIDRGANIYRLKYVGP